jgi:hypothetical protein
MSSFGEDPLVLTYFVPCIEIRLEDINNEIFEQVMTIILRSQPNQEPELEQISSSDP